MKQRDVVMLLNMIAGVPWLRSQGTASVQESEPCTLSAVSQHSISPPPQRRGPCCFRGKKHLTDSGIQSSLQAFSDQGRSGVQACSLQANAKYCPFSYSRSASTNKECFVRWRKT